MNTIIERITLEAKYNRDLEIGCDGCGEVWTQQCEGFWEAARSLNEGHYTACIACDDELDDKYNPLEGGK